MSIVVHCGECGQMARVKDQMAGRSIRCRACGRSIPIPGADDDLVEPDSDDAIPVPRRSRGASPSRRRSSTGSGFAVLGKLISIAVSVVVCLGLISLRVIARVGRMKGNREQQNAQAPQPNPGVRPNINLPPPGGAPQFNPAPAFPSPAGNPSAATPPTFPGPNFPPANRQPFVPPTTTPGQLPPNTFPPVIPPVTPPVIPPAAPRFNPPPINRPFSNRPGGMR